MALIGPRKERRPKISKAAFKTLLKYKRELKRRATRSERRFKEILSLIGIKFEEQRIFIDTRSNKGYIVDFFIGNLNLVFEIDGKSHEGKRAQEYDEVRTSFLATRGISVVRIKNEYTANSSVCKKYVERVILERERELHVDERRKSLLRVKRHEFLGKTPKEERERLMQEFLERGGEIRTVSVPQKRRKTPRKNNISAAPK